jgi:glycosyltransferase involved in cell wall biosynthesis
MSTEFLSFSLCALWLLLVIELWRGFSKLRDLSELPEILKNFKVGQIRAAIVVAARNEAQAIENSVRSLLQQNCPNLDVVVVNDRSTDETSQILEKLKKEDSRLKVVTITELPKGWLGKCYANVQGAVATSADWILFTDGDVEMDPSALLKAVAYAEHQGLDHLAGLPFVHMPGFFLNSFAGFFGSTFLLFTRPWNVPNPKSKDSIGVGAFNLVRAASYKKIGGHEVVKLCPDEDVKLGRAFKKARMKSELVIVSNLARVEWYSSVWGVVRGLEKNAFAGCDYNVAMALIGPFIHVVFLWIPLLFLLFGNLSLWAFSANALSIVLAMIPYLFLAKKLKSPRLAAPLLWVHVGLFCFIVWRSMMLFYWRDGIVWRDTYYTARELQDACRAFYQRV